MGRSNIIVSLLVVGLLISNGWMYVQRQQLSDTLQTALDDQTTLQDQYDTLLRNYDPLNTSLTEIQDAYTRLDSEYNELHFEYQSLTSNYSSLLDEREVLLDNLTQLQRHLKDLLHADDFTHFTNLSHLTDWLALDITDQNLYVPDIFDCDDFAGTLMTSAFNSGYLMTMISVYYSEDLLQIDSAGETYWLVPKTWSIEAESEMEYHMFGNHMMNLAYVIDIGWVVIEPQTDDVYSLGTHEL